ncbi:hypothetical protein ACHAPX_002816 [Trichoderma viride]
MERQNLTKTRRPRPRKRQPEASSPQARCAQEIIPTEASREERRTEGGPAPQESTKNEQVGISSAVSSSTESDSTGSEGDELVPVSKRYEEAWKTPSLGRSRRGRRFVWRSKLREDDASFSATKIHEPGHRQTSNKKDFYSKMATRIRDKGLAAPKQPTSCTCQAEVLELRQATNKMNDSLGSLTQTLEQVVKKLDTVAQDAKIHRKGTQRLIAAANGEKTPEDSEDEGAKDVSAAEELGLFRQGSMES